MKIAVAVDGSEHAIRAVKLAIDYLKLVKENVLTVIHVDQIQDVKNAYLLENGDNSIAMKHATILQPIRELIEKEMIECKIVLLKGEPSEMITNYVNGQIDQLFIGSRGLNRLQQFVLGSVSHSVMKHVHCPVTIVK